jgi:hypothetical protein
MIDVAQGQSSQDREPSSHQEHKEHHTAPHCAWCSLVSDTKEIDFFEIFNEKFLLRVIFLVLFCAPWWPAVLFVVNDFDLSLP